MKLYLDTEFNSFGGELISLALVAADITLPCFYVELGKPNYPHPWVVEHVFPALTGITTDRTVARHRLADFLRHFDEVTVVANWHEDFVHLLQLLLIGGGNCVAIPPLTMELRKAEVHSGHPHNALFDALALRRCFEPEYETDEEE